MGAHTMNVWSQYHWTERGLFLSPRLAAISFSEDHGLGETRIEIYVKDLLEDETYRFYADELEVIG